MNNSNNKSTGSYRTRGRFQNPPGSPPNTASFRDMFSFLSSQILSSSAPKIPDDHVLPEDIVKAQMAMAGNPSVTWLGHSTFIIRIDGKVILTDPYLGKTAGPFGIGPKRYVNSPLSVSELPKADIMLVSHNHYDHLDAPTIEAYPHKRETQVIVPLGLGRFFTKRGYQKVLEHDWWDTLQFDTLEITTLPAIHFSGRGLTDRNKTLWASFGINAGDGRIWFSGDTANGAVFEEIAKRTKPFDLALVAIGAYEPQVIMKPVHANPEEAIEIVRMIGARRAIGMHWGAISLTPEDPFEAPQRFQLAAERQGFGRENAWILKIGETRSIS